MVNNNSIIAKIGQAAGSLPLHIAMSLSCQKLLMPFYHAVADEELPHIKHLYPARNIKTFESDLDFFLKNYKPLSLDELSNHIQNNQQLTKPSFHLTFDDGLSQLYDVIAPILLRKGVPATFFINTAFIDNKDLFFRYKASLLIDRIKQGGLSADVESQIMKIFKNAELDGGEICSMFLAIDYSNKELLDNIASIINVDFASFLRSQKPYLTTDQIKSLINQGFTIGSHSIDHPHFSEITLDQQIQQLDASLSLLNAEFKIDHPTFSFPFSCDGVRREFFDYIYANDNQKCELTFGISGLKKDIYPQHIHRIPMEKTHQSAQAIISKEYFYYLLKMPLGKNTIKRDA